jgi:hypothetical protein
MTVFCSRVYARIANFRLIILTLPQFRAPLDDFILQKKRKEIRVSRIRNYSFYYKPKGIRFYTIIPMDTEKARNETKRKGRKDTTRQEETSHKKPQRN